MKIAFLTYSKLINGIASDSLIVQLLKKKGIFVEVLDWRDSSVSWHDFNAVVIRSCWDYYLYFNEFVCFLNRLDASGIKVINPLATVLWSLDKRYLLDLESSGVEIVPTRIFSHVDKSSIFDFLSRQGGRDFIVKPTIAASAYKVCKFNARDVSMCLSSFDSILGESDVILQKFLPEIYVNGEWSIVFINGCYSHSILKKPKSGEFRVQKRFGGDFLCVDPPSFVLNSAHDILRYADKEYQYARVDGVIVDGKFLLMELELAEPILFLNLCPDASERFADCIVETVA